MKKIEYTYDEIFHYYNEDYINFTLKNALQSKVLCAKFISIKDLHIRPAATTKSWKFYDKDPYLYNDYAKDKLKLGRDIVKHGTYWPFGIKKPVPGEKLYITEGNHRIVSLKFLVANGELSEDFKVLCMWQNFDDRFQKIEPITIKYLIGMKYGNNIYDGNYIKKYIYEDIINNGGRLISNKVVQASCDNANKALYPVYEYSYYLKDYFYKLGYQIEPSRIINDKKCFKEWLECYHILEGSI